jgi:hypothetical protein
MTDNITKSQVGAQITTTHSHNSVDDILLPPLQGFTTANRPTNVKQYTIIYDTTLNKPIVAKVGGASPTWTDFTGTVV